MVQDRHRAILSVLRRKPKWAMDALRGEVAVSRSTLRRDLMELENLGKVIRVRGHVLCAGRATGEPGYDTRRSLNLQAKRCVGESAAGLVPAGLVQIVMFRPVRVRIVRVQMAKAAHPSTTGSPG